MAEGVQPTTEEHWSEEEASAERACGLGIDAATEIERLRKIIDDYASICEASSREIKMLRERLGQ